MYYWFVAIELSLDCQRRVQFGRCITPREAATGRLRKSCMAAGPKRSDVVSKKAEKERERGTLLGAVDAEDEAHHLRYEATLEVEMVAAGLQAGPTRSLQPL
jgi:hypothetical protein